MSRLRWVWAFVLVSAVGCQGTVAPAYRISDLGPVDPSAIDVRVYELEDNRPEEEITGAGAGMFNRSTKDELYSEPVAKGITNALIDELRLRNLDADPNKRARYEVLGAVNHYRALIVPPRTAFVPYLSYLTWMWTNDQIAAGVALDLAVHAPSGEIFRQQYQISQDTEVWVGLFGLASTARRMDRPALVELLRSGLDEVLDRAANDIAAAIRREELTRRSAVSGGR